MIDSLGREVRGDHLLYILAVSQKLPGVVATVMSNLALEQALSKRGVTLVRTQVGDRYVLEALQKTDYKLGGEESGHIIMPDLAQTGDGLLAALQVARYLNDSDIRLDTWYDELKLLPQALQNVKLNDKSSLDQPAIKEWIESKERQLAGLGRLLIRPSGTEPLVRIMVEAPNAQVLAAELADQMTSLLNKADA